MGHNSSRGSEQISIQINHPKFVNSKVLHDLGKQFLKTRVPCDEKSYKTWKELLQKHKTINHEYLLLPVKHKYHSTGLCATRGEVEIDYDNYPYLLTEEIYHRKGKKVPFSEPQMWYLLYAYLSVKNYLKQHGEYPYNLIGDIRPQNIFINQNGEVRFSNLFSWPGEKVNYRKTFDGITTYLSPEDYELLQLGSMSNQKNNKSEFFSIGFTLVSAATLKDNNDVYNIEKQKFDQYEAKKRINAFKCSTIYSELLRAVISSLCSFQIKKRIDQTDLWVWITKYERRIITKQPFMIEEVPPKINEHINILRTSILAIEPSNSILNLNSIKSLKGSQAKNEFPSVKKIFKNQVQSSVIDEKKNDQVRTLKEVQKGSVIDQQSQKRKSRIVINPGIEQKVFYSPTNNAYFTSQVGEKSHISQLKQQVGSQGSKLQSFYSPPSNLKGTNQKYEPLKLSKSPEGFYSPRGSNTFRVFIQYKSPTKPVDKPYAQTVYIGKEGQTQSVVVVESMEVVQTVNKKDSDSKSQKSQKSGDSNRQNRFIEQTKKQSEKREAIKVSEKSYKQTETQTFKKESPIHRIMASQEAIAHGVSEVVSEEIIMPPTKVSAEIKHLTESAERVQEMKDFQIEFQIKDNFVKAQSNIVSRQNVNSETPAQLNSKPRDLEGDFTTQFLQNFNGFSPVKRDSKKKLSLHESKNLEEERSRDRGMKNIQLVLSEGDILRHIEEEQLDQLTFDDGHHVIPPTKYSVQSNSIKFEISQRHESSPKVSRHTGDNTPAYDQLVAQIFPVEKGTIKKKQTLSQIEEEKHQRMEEEIQRKLAQLEETQKQIIEEVIQDATNLKEYPEQATRVNQNNQIVILQSSSQQVQQNEVDANMVETLQREVLQIGNQIVDLKNNFEVAVPEIPQVLQTAHFEQSYEPVEEAMFVEHISTAQEIIQNEISSEKQPSELQPLQDSHHSEVKAEQNTSVIGTKINTNGNILILDEDQGIEQEEIENKIYDQQVAVFQAGPSFEYENTITIEERPLIPLGPETQHHEEHEEAFIQQIERIEQQQNSHRVQEDLEKAVEPVVQQVQQTIQQKISQVVQNERIEQVKKPQSPFQQIEQIQEPSEFHSSHIEQNVPLSQKLIIFQQQSSKLSHNQLQSANVGIQEQVIDKPSEHREVIQEVIEVSLNGNNTVTNYETVEYHHQVSLGGSGSGDKIVYNVIEVNDHSLPLDNGVGNDSEIKGSGKMHSRVVDESNEIVQLEQVHQVLPQEIITEEQQYFTLQSQNTRITIEQVVSQKVVVQPLEVAKQTVVNEVHHSFNQSYNDSFLNDIQQTNRKLKQIQETQTKQKQELVILEQTLHVDDRAQSDVQQIGEVLEAYPLPQQEVVNEKSQQEETVQKNFQSIPDTLLDDPFLRDVQQTNMKLQQIHQQEETQKRISEPFVLHDLQKIDEPQVETPVVLQSSYEVPQQMIVKRVETTVQEVVLQVQHTVHDSEFAGSLKDQTGSSQIQNSQIQFEVMKEVVGASKQLNKYEVIAEEQNIVQEAKQQVHQQSKQILPVQSDPKEDGEKYETEIIEPESQSNHFEVHAHRQVSTDEKIEQNEGNKPHLQTREIPAEGHYLQFSNLQVTLQGAPTQSQFGNISEIMDINKDFNNTLNTKERNFLQGTADPRSEEFFKELINLSQKGIIHDADFDRVKMTKQDRDKLTNFMKRWQNLNTQEQENMQQYIDEFRQAITRSQIEQPTQQNEKAKLRMSAQDKETLRLVVERLNGPSDKRHPVNYDQSYVNVECSDMKTDIVVVEKDTKQEKKQTDNHEQRAIDQDVANVIAQNIQVYIEQTQREQQSNQQENLNYSERRNDIVSEVIEINRALNGSNNNKSDQTENNILVLESSPNNIEASQNFSTEVNAPTANVESGNLEEIVTHVIEQHSQQGHENNNTNEGGFEGILHEVKSAANDFKDLVEEAIDNFDTKEIRGSQVDASIGQKSDRQDPLASSFYQQKGSSSENLHVLKNHRTYSQPNNFFDHGSLSGDASPTVHNEVTIVHTTIVEQVHEVQEHVPEEIQVVQIRVSEKKDLIEQITEINHAITTDVQKFVEHRDNGTNEEKTIVSPVVDQKQKVPVKQEVNVSSRSSQRRSKPRDFLDEVMEVNKIVNQEVHKDYYEDNKFLNQNQSQE